MNHMQLSKQLAYILRHAPWEYELELDDEGWVPLPQLLEALNEDRGGVEIGEEDIREMMHASSKQRFEIGDGRIRAFYGHSVPGRIRKRLADPPDVLYHGTVLRFVPLIREGGLKPMSRQYVHLSLDVDMAQTVGRRRGADVVILTVRARDAAAAGVYFYEELNGVWLADVVEPQWIEFPTGA